MIDKFGRTVNYARISLTDKCNLSCVYCKESSIKISRNYISERLSLQDYKFIIKGLVEVGITKFKFTGGEPLLYPYLIELIRYTYEDCGIDDISISTNGIGLYDMAYELYKNGLNNVNISIDSLKEYKYKTITRGGNLKEVLKSIEKCLNIGIKVKINCVIINEFNDDEILDFILMTKFYSLDIRFIELVQRGQANQIYINGYFNIGSFIEDIDEMNRVDIDEDSSVKYYKFKGSKGRVGVIETMKDPYCHKCSKIIVTEDGYIKLCIDAKEQFDIKEYINKPLIFREILKDIILQK